MFRILIVDDMQNFRKSFREILDGNFPNVVIEEAANGKEALERADSFRPHLVFMDIRLPDESGLELTKKIKAQYPKVTVVMFTSHDIPEYREAVTQYGASGFLVKGTATKEDVQALVKSVISNQQTANI